MSKLLFLTAALCGLATVAGFGVALDLRKTSDEHEAHRRPELSYSTVRRAVFFEQVSLVPGALCVVTLAAGVVRRRKERKAGATPT